MPYQKYETFTNYAKRLEVLVQLKDIIEGKIKINI